MQSWHLNKKQKLTVTSDLWMDSLIHTAAEDPLIKHPAADVLYRTDCKDVNKKSYSLT